MKNKLGMITLKYKEDIDNEVWIFWSELFKGCEHNHYFLMPLEALLSPPKPHISLVIGFLGIGASWSLNNEIGCIVCTSNTFLYWFALD